MNRAMLFAASMLLTACGGGGSYSGGSGTTSTPMYSVGGTVSGLAAGKTVVLQDNGGDNLSVTANGPFTFQTPITYLTGYSVTVLTQPTGQTCTLAGASGAYPGMSVNNVQVTCT